MGSRLAAMRAPTNAPRHRNVPPSWAMVTCSWLLWLAQFCLQMTLLEPLPIQGNRIWSLLGRNTQDWNRERPCRATFESDGAVGRAQFLFGEAITDYLKETRSAIVDLRKAELMAQSEDDATRAKGCRSRGRLLDEIPEFYEKFTDLVRPYVKMHQKAPPF
jgi:hypothetical protein